MDDGPADLPEIGQTYDFRRICPMEDCRGSLPDEAVAAVSFGESFSVEAKLPIVRRRCFDKVTFERSQRMFASDTIKFRTGIRPPETSRSRTPSHHDQVMHRLGLGIVGGEFAENAMLPNEAELLARFSVSRTVLREALKSLAAKGMIVARAKVGTRVTPRRNWNYFDPDILYWQAETGIDKSFLNSLAEMRLAFEPEAAALAAERRSDAHVAELSACIHAMEHAHSSADEFVEADLRFHTAIAEASGNPLMRSICHVIQVALEAAFIISSPIPNTSAHARSVARHRIIAQAVELRDPDSARAAMRAVIIHGLKRIEAV